MKASTAPYLLILSLTTLPGWAQGTVDFRNGGITFGTRDDRLVYDWHDGQCRPLVGTNYVAGLFYLPGADQDIALPTAGIQAGALAFFREPTTSSPGTWRSPLNVGNVRTLDGVPMGATATLQVRVWDITKYDTFAEAFRSGDYAWSAPFNYTGPGPGIGGAPALFYMANLRAFGCVPEPSTLVLGALGIGIASILPWRRGKRTTEN